jgi:alginate O-acetyltransferase complex protein AlgI
MRTTSLEPLTLTAASENRFRVVPLLRAAATVLAAMAIRPYVSAWFEMWLVAAVLFANFKWLTWVGRSKRLATVGNGRALGYFFGWVGLNADEFCEHSTSEVGPQVRDWAAAIAKTMLGGAVLWELIRLLPADRPAIVGAAGFAAMLMFLHFGLFHLLALLWQRTGVAVRPIMHWPLFATSLADFWSQRWNRAYRRVSFEYFFRPAVNRFGIVAGTLTAFLMSGLIHDLVISFPAGAGYGGPTAYFLIQGVGLLLERTTVCRRSFTRHPWLGWLYALSFIVGPVGLLFHEPFLTYVIGPFLGVIGAR